MSLFALLRSNMKLPCQAAGLRAFTAFSSEKQSKTNQTKEKRHRDQTRHHTEMLLLKISGQNTFSLYVARCTPMLPSTDSTAKQRIERKEVAHRRLMV